MRQAIEPRKALEHEFVCYYNGDELPPVTSEGFRNSLPQRTWESAVRLQRAVGDDKVTELIGVLESLKNDPNGTLMSVIAASSQTAWADDPQSWAVFQRLVEQIIGLLREGPGPRPQ